jgi:hypothetical protein
MASTLNARRAPILARSVRHTIRAPHVCHLLPRESQLNVHVRLATIRTELMANALHAPTRACNVQMQQPVLLVWPHRQ